jgi:hypothetical protein
MACESRTKISIQIENYVYMFVKAWGGDAGISDRTQHNTLFYKITHETNNYDTTNLNPEAIS